MKDKIAYLTRIKDEEALIPYQLIYYYNIGVRNFYITFNNSNYLTRKLVNDFALNKKDITLYEFEEQSTAYNQAEVFNHMSNIAYDNGHTWIIPSDADEILILKKKSLYKFIKKYDNYDYGYINFRWFDYMSTHRDDDFDLNYFTKWKYREPHPRPQSKIICKWHPDCQYGDGHHLLITKRVKMEEVPAEDGFFAHYANRSFDQVRKKRIRIGEAFNQKYGEGNDKPQSREYRQWKKDGEMYFVNEWQRICQERKSNFDRYVLDPINPKLFIA